MAIIRLSREKLLRRSVSSCFAVVLTLKFKPVEQSNKADYNKAIVRKIAQSFKKAEAPLKDIYNWYYDIVHMTYF